MVVPYMFKVTYELSKGKFVKLLNLLFVQAIIYIYLIVCSQCRYFRGQSSLPRVRVSIISGMDLWSKSSMYLSMIAAKFHHSPAIDSQINETPDSTGQQ